MTATPRTASGDVGADIWHVPVGDAASAVEWLAAHRGEIRRRLAGDGVVHLRGLALPAPGDFAAAADVLLTGDCPRREPFAQRPRLHDQVYGAPQWPSYRDMCPHNEQCYAASFPRTLFLGAPPDQPIAGATLLADGVRVWERLDPALRARLETSGWLLVRNFRPYVGMAWSDAFGATRESDVSAYCAASGIDVEWRLDGTLRTRQRRPAALAHPESGRPAWFNQILFLNQWSLQDEERQVLVGAYGEIGLPFNTFYGDGSAIERSDVDLMQQTVDDQTVRVEWHPGDVLLVDNVRMGHGRSAHRGEWPLWEAQGDAMSWPATSGTEE